MPEGYKIVCQLDDEGYLVGAAHAFENPVRPGSHLIPGGAIDEPVPSAPEGARAKWLYPGWQFEAPQVEPQQQAQS